MGISGRLASFFLKSQLTPLIALVLVLLGVFAVLVTPREEEPQIAVTMANVLIAYPGASAQEVERVVATPAEQVLSQMTGVDHVYSVSYPGQAVLTVQFKVGEDHIKSLVKLHDVVQANRDWLPDNLGVLPPLVKAKGIDDVPIVSLTLWRDDPLADRLALTQVAHALEVELKRVVGTREVYTLGAAANQVQVKISPDKLNAYQLTVPELIARLQASNVSQQAGKVLQNNQEIWLQTGNFLSNADDVAQLMVAVVNGKPIYLKDVASVSQGADLPNNYVWLGSKQGEFNAVTLAISKKSGANAVDIAEQLLARVDNLRGTVIPDDVHVTITRNYGETANDKAMKLIQKLLFATAAVIALVWLSMGRREAMVVGGAVLLTLAATLFASWAWGFTLNRVSLFALIFSIGILVDDAIVVVENIHRHRQLTPEKPLTELIPLAVDEVGGPTILATFTVIAALLPMAFVSGLMGPYMSPIPINASMGMLISLLIAFIVTPWLVLRFAGKSHTAHATHRNYFQGLLTPFLLNKKARAGLWIGIVLLVMAAMSLGVFKLVILKMLPFDNKSEFQVVVDMPTGTPLEQTQAATRALAQHIATIPEVTDYQAYVGTSSPINFNGLVRQYYLRSQSEQADIQVNLQDKHHRSRSSHEIASSVIPELNKIAATFGAKVKVVEVPPGPPVMSPIVAEIYGPDYAAMRDMASKVKQQFAKTEGIVAIDDSTTEAAPKWQISIQQHKAMLLGIEPAQISQLIATTLSGRSVTSLHESGAKYAPAVQVVLADEARNQLTPILQLKLRSRDGALVPISELVTVQQVSRDYPIFHKDLLPVVYVVGDMNGKLDSPLYGMFSIKLPDNLTSYFFKQPSDVYRGFALKWDGEWQITFETFRDMGIAYGVGLVLIYLLVVAQFRSYLVPLIIMAPIPLTIIGVMPGHALLGAQYTATSMIGMIALAGIIVRNSILLVDFINLQLAQGVPLQQAVIHAANARAKPILLTGIAAMLGALFILDDPIFNGLAISLIFGILISTLLTLVVIPVLYYASLYKQKGA